MINVFMSLRCSYLNWAHCPLLRSQLSLWERVLWIYGMWVSAIQLCCRRCCMYMAAC